MRTWALEGFGSIRSGPNEPRRLSGRVSALPVMQVHEGSERSDESARACVARGCGDRGDGDEPNTAEDPEARQHHRTRNGAYLRDVFAFERQAKNLRAVPEGGRP